MVLLHGDCLKLLRKIEDESITTCITDPPYNYEFIGKDWNIEEIERRVSRVQNSATMVKHIPYGSGLSGGVRNKRWYDRNRSNIVSYSKWIEAWGAEVYRVLKPGSYCLVFNSSRTIAQVQVALENVGFYARDILIWVKNSGIPKGVNLKNKLVDDENYSQQDLEGWHSCLRNEYEAIVVVQKPLENNYIETFKRYGTGLLYTKNETNGFQSNILTGYKKTPEEKTFKHCTVKPLSLMNKLIRITTPLLSSNVVIDPFMGTGSTLLAAKNLGTSYLGIEINKSYYDIAYSRLHDVNVERPLVSITS